MTIDELKDELIRTQLQRNSSDARVRELEQCIRAQSELNEVAKTELTRLRAIESLAERMAGRVALADAICRSYRATHTVRPDCAVCNAVLAYEKTAMAAEVQQ